MAPGRVPGRGAGERHGRRNRPVAPLPRRRRLALVVLTRRAAGVGDPIHDHLAWGLVGLYRGTQDEQIFAQRDGALELVEQRSLEPGDFYVLIPPRDDIHRVRTTSAETSVSIHLLTNDTGCIWRHAWDTASGEARPFRSGYVNVACDDRFLVDRPARVDD